MIVAILVSAALAQSAQPTAKPIVVTEVPPPPIVSVQVAPPPVIVPRVAPAIIRSEPAIVVPIAVHVSAGDRVLFSDTLRVARNSAANYSESRNEASPMLCADVSSYDRSERSSLNIQIYWRDSGIDAPGANVSVNWQRPHDGTDCGPLGSRGVQLSQSVRLAPGESAVIKGDAGLTVRLTRR